VIDARLDAWMHDQRQIQRCWWPRDNKAFRRQYPMSDEPWTIAEDRKLLRLFERGKEHLSTLPKGERRVWWCDLAEKFGRTDQAIRTRLWGLLAGKRATAI